MASLQDIMGEGGGETPRSREEKGKGLDQILGGAGLAEILEPKPPEWGAVAGAQPELVAGTFKQEAGGLLQTVTEGLPEVLEAVAPPWMRGAGRLAGETIAPTAPVQAVEKYGKELGAAGRKQFEEAYPAEMTFWQSAATQAGVSIA
ncbi:unnamed protein product, partial [marine sediment metagenome]